MEEIQSALDKELVTEIALGQEILLEKNALMIPKQLIYENKGLQTRLGVILYPFQKSANPYENYLQLQLYPKTHTIWHTRKLFKLDDFDLILKLANRFPNNYYLFDYLYCKYLDLYNKGALSSELENLMLYVRKTMDHSCLWCWYRCIKLELPSNQNEVVKQINKMAAFQWNRALENIINALYVEFKINELEIFLEPLLTRRQQIPIRMA